MSQGAGPMIDDAIEDAIVAHLDGRAAAMEDTLRELVALPSGPLEREGQRAMLQLLAKQWRRLGFVTELIDARGGLQHLVAHRPAAHADAKRVLLLGHLDTVFDEASGFVGMTRAGDWIGGPGVADMKGGLVVAHAAVAALLHARRVDSIDWTVLLTSDEELGSPTSRPLVERAATGRDLVLCFEPGRPGFGVVDSRGGVGAFSVAVHGRAAHAGIAAGQGRSAIEAAARLVVALAAVANPAQARLLNVGTISGGSKRNVVPELCRFEVDARAPDGAGAAQLEAGLRAAAAQVAVDCDVRIEVRGGFHRPPWPRDGRNAAVVQHFVSVARDLGLQLPVESSAGGSDASIAATMGVATLDGLGPVGHGMHSPDERIERSTLVERAKLVALALLRFVPAERNLA